MNKPRVIENLLELRAWRKSQGGARTIGFVPTMGALHEGHASLLELSREENDISVLSIYVNPTQFNNSEDLKNYPITWENDLQVATEASVDVIFKPSYSEIYADDYRYKVQENSDSQVLCGAHRPGHFDGVLTVVLKFFQLVQPKRAYFGEKDFQQLRLIQGMARSLFLDLEIVPVPTLREKDGLAMSSRNFRLTPEERKTAPALYEILHSVADLTEARSRLEKLNFKVDYIEDHWNRRFVAAHLGKVRLIDNIEL